MSAHRSSLRPVVTALLLAACAGSAAAADLPPAEVLETTGGRMHVMLVHFPIALLAVAGVVEFTRFVLRRKEPSPFVLGCLVFGGLGAAAAATSGWFYALHEHPGRSVEELVEWHRWTGVVTASAALLAIPFALARRNAEGGFVVFAYRFLFVVAVVGAGGAGHLGGELVYGEDYVFEPVIEHYGWDEETQDGPARVAAPAITQPAGGAPASAADVAISAVPDETLADLAAGHVADPSPEFLADVQMLFEVNCFECHGERKQKGKLRLDQAEFVWGADPSKWAIVPGDSAASSVYQRISLPADDLDLMPPDGEPLDPDEIALIKAWIDGGARWEGVDVAALVESAGLAPVPSGGAAPAPEPQPPAFESVSPPAEPADADAEPGTNTGADTGDDETAQADDPLLGAPLQADDLAAVEAALPALRERGARAMATALSSQAVEVDLSLAADVGDDDLALLADTAPALVWLNLARTDVGDDGLAHLAGLHALRTLRLDGTAVGDAGLMHLADLHELEVLNLVGTAVSDAGVPALAALPGLRTVYLWGSAVSAEGAESLRASRPDLHVDTGAELEQAVAALESEAAATPADG